MIFDKLFGKNNRSGELNYRIGEILYLVDWKPYLEIVGKANVKALIEIYVYRIWLYNYIFRKTASDVDAITNKMLRQLINEIKNVGNAVFVEAIFGSRVNKDDIKSMSTNLMDKVYAGLEYYDGIAIKYMKNDKDIEAALLHFALELELKPLDNEADGNKLAEIQQLFNEQLLTVVPDIAIQAIKNETA